MSRITLKKDERLALVKSDIKLAALNALGSIPGVKSPEVVEVRGDIVVMTYEWAGGDYFQETNEYLLKHGFSKCVE